jgi:hypothetical protein
LLSIKPTIDVSIDDEYAFRNACTNGHFEIAKWLLSVKPTINISANGEFAFVNACKNGHFEIAKWLHSLQKNMTIHALAADECAFHNACEKGHLEIAQWLFSVWEKLDIEISEDNYIHSFILACKNGNLEVAQWLLSIYESIDIASCNNAAFKYACSRNRINIAQWLQSLLPEHYKIVIENNQIIEYYIIVELPYMKNIVELTIQHIEDNVCPICYDSHVEVQTNCGHNFCDSCMTNYYSKCENTCNCPYCRQPVTSFTKLVIE